MAATPKHRQAIVATAAALFRRQGYAATGTNQIVTTSGAPKGSLYHYFPGGKEQIAEASVAHSGELVRGTLDRLLQESSPADALRAYARLVAGWLQDSAFRDGSPIATTLLELAPGSTPVTAAGRLVYTSWCQLLAHAMVDAGAPADRADRLGRLAIAALDGALLLARVEQSAEPLLAVMDEVAALCDAATGG